MTINQKRVVCLLVLCFSFSGFTQNPAEQKAAMPLVEVLVLLQEQHEVQFNYAEDVISGIKTPVPPKHYTLQETLAFLKTTTGLNYLVMNGAFILIQRQERLVVCGYLLDGNTKQPITRATIQVSGNYVVSDDLGFFEIEVENQFSRITLRHLGYGTLVRFADEFMLKGCREVLLKPNLQALNEVVISNFLVKGVNKVSSGAFNIDFSDFDILPGLVDADVLHSIQAFPGVMSVNETVSNINIRGGANDQNLILWDGIKMYQSGHFFGLISIYNPQITEQVSLIKNGTNAALTDGVSGTISMKSNPEITSGLRANFGLSLIDANAFGDIPLGEKSSVQVAVRKSISDLVKTPTYRAFFERISQDSEVEGMEGGTSSDKQFDFHDASLRWLYQPSKKDRLRLNVIYVNNALTFNENASVNGLQTSRESKLTQKSIAGAIHYSRQWSKTFETQLDVYETDYNLKSVNVNVIDGQRYLQENNISETSIKLKGNKNIGHHLNLLFGYHFVETKVSNLDDVDTPIYRLLISEVLRSHGAFSQMSYKGVKNKLNAQFGLRYDYLTKFKKSILEPRLSVNYKLSDYFSVALLGEFKHQSMSQLINFQNDFLGIEKRRWQLSNNQDVPVIRSKQGGLGINYNRKGFLVSVDGYCKFVDGITTQSQGFQNQYEFVKAIGHYNVFGIDFLTRKQIKNMNVWLGYSYMTNLYAFPDLEPEDFPSNFDITHTITLGGVYSYNNLSVSAGLNWHTGKPISVPAENTPQDNAVVFGKTNQAALQDYLRMDVSALYDFKLHRKSRGKVGFSVWNVFDKDNEINKFYRVENGQVKAYTQKSLGITPNVFVRAYF
ncbi:TonB-dependent receptor [Mangrovimonas yunxiaonensis]|uniref:TonB-dependent receptor n=1 Tax=Mangrovimonas yunxiaonensis TaxID=1197477 RepID=A0A084TMP1_9FLAO|nr:TonB-dependent receptor [Mangrovimonas yunxiaonensis]